jgi:urease accessory protein
MTARASLASERVAGGGIGVSRICRLRSDGPLILRPTKPWGFEPRVCSASGAARVSLAAGAAGPLGGDDFALDVRVGAASTLVLRDISATVLLSGPRGGRSRMRITVIVEEGATFVWLPEPLIAADGCDHVHDIDVRLASRARLLMRDELLLGRHRERPGDLTQTIRVGCEGRTLFHQQLRVGARAPGWTSPAVLGANKCVGSLLVVDPVWAGRPPAGRVFAPDAALLPLVGPAIIISALASNSLLLRRHLDHGIDLLGAPWASVRDGVALTGSASAGAASRVDGEPVTVP